MGLFKKKSKKEDSAAVKPTSKKADNNKKKKKEIELLKIPKTVQDTIPYKYIYKNGIIEVSTGVFSKSYILSDTNFRISSNQGQKKIYDDYSTMLSTFGETVKVEVSIYNKNLDIIEFQKKVLLEMGMDDLNEYRDEYNQMLIDKMSGTNNNLTKLKILTLTIEEESIQEAVVTFNRLDIDTLKMISNLTGEKSKAMTAMERLCMLYDIYNPNARQKFLQKVMIDGEEKNSISLKQIHEMGLSTKDVVGPSSFEIKPDKLILGGHTHTRTYFVSTIPTWLRGDMFTDLASLPCTMLASVHYRTLQQDIANKIIKVSRMNINSNVAEAEKRAVQGGYGIDLISQSLQDAKTDVKNLTNDITKRNQKIVMTTLVVTLFASSENELKSLHKQLTRIANKHQILLEVLSLQQEYGFATALPLGVKKVAVERLLTSESAAMIIPFAVKELSQENGVYFGLNPLSNGLIMYNRLSGMNYNGLILGMPGSGKSFMSKKAIINTILSTDDEVYVLDPEREYLKIAMEMGGEVVRIANGSNIYLNPLDMDIEYADEGDPVKMKCDYLATIIDIAIGGRYGLSPIERSLIDRVGQEIYEPYIDYLKRTGKNIDTAKAPTLEDFYNRMLEQGIPEAQNIALALERFVKGSQDIFAHRTNVNNHSRFIVYDIKDIGSGLKEMGMQICINEIWNKMIANRKKGKRTWLWIDELHLFLNKQTTADFIQEIWKRARKWNGIPTGVRLVLRSNKQRRSTLVSKLLSTYWLKNELSLAYM